jgi:hypothetical protein
VDTTTVADEKTHALPRRRPIARPETRSPSTVLAPPDLTVLQRVRDGLRVLDGDGEQPD